MENKRKNFLSMMFIACDDFILREEKIIFYFGDYRFICDYWGFDVIINNKTTQKVTYLELYSCNYKIPYITLEIGLFGINNIKQHSYSSEAK